MNEYAEIAENMVVMLYDRVQYQNDKTNQLKLDGNEQATLRLTWGEWTAGDPTKRGVEMFERMFSNVAETRRLFAFAADMKPGAKMQQSQKILFHVSRVMRYIGKAIESVDKMEDFVPMLMQAGGRHGTKGYNVPSNYFPYLGVAMRELMKKDLKDFTKAKEDLWKKFYEFIIKQMTDGQSMYGN